MSDEQEKIKEEQMEMFKETVEEDQAEKEAPPLVKFPPRPQKCFQFQLAITLETGQQQGAQVIKIASDMLHAVEAITEQYSGIPNCEIVGVSLIAGVLAP